MRLISSVTTLPLRQDAVAAQLTWTQLCHSRWWSSSSVSTWSVSAQLYLHGTSGTPGAPPTKAAPSPDQNTRPITGKVTADVGKTRGGFYRVRIGTCAVPPPNTMCSLSGPAVNRHNRQINTVPTWKMVNLLNIQLTLITFQVFRRLSVSFGCLCRNFWVKHSFYCTWCN